MTVLAPTAGAQAEREIEEAKENQFKFWRVLITSTWHVQLTGWVFLVLLTWMWTECTTLWFGRVTFLALIAVLTWGRWVLFPAVVFTGAGARRPCPQMGEPRHI
jgi:hypothetical protein